MAKKFHEQLQELKEIFDAMHIDIASALTIQGLYKEPEDFALQETGTLIRLIKTEDFHFRFDFKEMDSVGRIKTRKTGQACGGLLFNIRHYNHTVPESMDMKETTSIHECDGGFGMPYYGLITNTTFPEIRVYRFDFKDAEVFPETLQPLNEEIE